MAKAKLSKLVMPPLGPTQPLLHSVPLAVHWRPFPENAHGAGSSSATISTNREGRNHRSRAEGSLGNQTEEAEYPCQSLEHSSLERPLCHFGFLLSFKVHLKYSHLPPWSLPFPLLRSQGSVLCPHPYSTFPRPIHNTTDSPHGLVLGAPTPCLPEHIT